MKHSGCLSVTLTIQKALQFLWEPLLAGAVLIEKHFTLDKNLPGPDHKASISPDELIAMVRMIREIEQAIGTGEKVASTSEEKNKVIARRSLVASRAIAKDEIFSEANLTAKRPGSGLSPYLYWEKLGTPSTATYEQDEIIK